MTNSSKVAIIGAGPAGLTAAYLLAKAGVKVDVFETSDQCGGMAKTIPLWGQKVDLGPHRFFSKDPRINALWHEVIGDDYAVVKRLTRIFYRKHFFNYPLEPWNALKGLGVFEAVRCVLSYVRVRIVPVRDTSHFEGWVQDKFGARLFSIFFKSYSEKLWGLRCTELDADFAKQRIKKLSLWAALKDAFIPSKGAHATLIDSFLYPLEGSGVLYERMAKHILECGGSVHYNTKANTIKRHDSRFDLGFSDGTIKTFDVVISTMPLTALVQQLDPPTEVAHCASQLRFRNTILVYLEIKGQGYFPDQWVYVHAPEIAAGRVTNFTNWVPDICGESVNTILCMEYWCNTPDAEWSQSDERLIEQATRDITSSSLVPEGSVLQGTVIRLKNSYPVYQRGYQELLKPIQQFLDTIPNLYPIGRYGAFKYNNQDHSLLMGILAAESILSGKRAPLWHINADTEYQEDGKLTPPTPDASRQ